MKIIVFLLFIINVMEVNAQDSTLKHDWANLKRYANENKNLNPVSGNEKRIVFIGNSITESWSPISKPFFVNKPYINRGISGQTSQQILARFEQDVISLNPSVVVILAGINDIAENMGPVSLDTVYDNIIRMAQLAKVNNIKVVLSSVLPANEFKWRPGLEPAEKVITLNTMIRAYCDKHNLAYVDYYAKLVDDKKGLDKKYTDDAVHPTLAGYKIMEPLVEKAIKQALNQ